MGERFYRVLCMFLAWGMVSVSALGQALIVSELKADQVAALETQLLDWQGASEVLVNYADEHLRVKATRVVDEPGRLVMDFRMLDGKLKPSGKPVNAVAQVTEVLEDLGYPLHINKGEKVNRWYSLHWQEQPYLVLKTEKSVLFWECDRRNREVKFYGSYTGGMAILVAWPEGEDLEASVELAVKTMSDAVAAWRKRGKW